MASYDAIIIGAGHNGLGSALVLARAGFKVLVLERGPVAGGAAKSGALTLPGFIHDYYASNIGLFLGSSLYRAFGKDLHRAGFQFDVANQPYGSVFPGGRGLPIYMDPTATEQSIGVFSLKDVGAWHTLVEEFQEVAPYLFPLLQQPIPSWAFGRSLFRMGRRLGLMRTQEVIAQLLQSPRQFVKARFESPEMQALLIPWGYHLDFGPDVSGGATFPYLESMQDYLHGMAITHGGIGRLIESLVTVFKSLGGEMRLNTAVTQVMVRNGRAVGVRTQDGDEIAAKRAVVANVTPRRLFGDLVDASTLPASFVSKVEKFRYGPGTMMVHLALSGPVPWMARSLERSLYVHIAPYVDDVAKADIEARSGFLPESPLLVVGQQSAWDLSRAPQGRETLWIQVRSVPYQPQGDALHAIPVKGGWDDMKEAYADRVVDKVEEYAPGFRSKILARTVFSPLDLERDNPNLVGGDSVSGSHHLDQFYLFRPFPGWSRYRTPIAGLWMIGASTWPGGGLNATSGYLAAQAILKKTL